MISRTEFAKLVAEELARARSAIPPINSFHEGYGVIYEELCEFFDEVRKKRRDRDPAKLLAELVQVAAMCQRTAEDRGLMGDDQAIPGEDAKVDEINNVDGKHGQPSPTPPPGGFAATPPKEEGREVVVGSFRDSEGWAHITDDGRLRDEVDTNYW